MSEKTTEQITEQPKTRNFDKYEQFRRDLARAVMESNKAGAAEDAASARRGTCYNCNFYSCMIRLPRWRGAKITAICEELGVFAQKYPESGWWSISPGVVCGIGSGRMTGAAVLVSVMESKGYEVWLSRVMD